jgi:hypothetical protein
VPCRNEGPQGDLLWRQWSISFEMPERTTCPRNLPMGYRAKPVLTSESERDFSWGPVLWAGLHEWAADLVRLGLIPTGAYKDLEKFTSMIPCGECRADWSALLTQYPPDFSSPDAFFTWTVFIHNKVNEKLGREQWAASNARERWGLPTWPAALR